MNRSMFSVFMRAGLVAGTLDILCAIVSTYLLSGRGPGVIFRYIASALMGPDAFTGGTGVALAGLLLHYLIAFGWTLLFFVSYGRIGKLKLHWAVTGFMYGLVVWSAMNLIVVPVSKIGPRPFVLSSAALQAGILVVAVGLPISYFAHRFLRTSN